MINESLEPVTRAPRQPKRRILFVEQFYYPDGWGGAELPLDLTIHLARTGFDVEVICGADQYAPLEAEPPCDPRLHGIRIRRIPSLVRGHIHRVKMIRQVWFYAALLPLLLLRRPPDIVVAQTNPPLAVIVAAAVARMWRKPMMIIAMDIYPEVLFAHGAIRATGPLSRVLSRAFGWAYESAQRVVSLGPTMSERLMSKGVAHSRIVEISNWATGAAGLVSGSNNSLRTEWGLGDKFVLLYSGNLGLAHEFETLLRGVERAHRAVPSLRLIIVGRGNRLAAVRRRVGELGIESIVRFNDPLPAERLPESFGIANLGIVTLQSGFEGLVVPSKLQGYMARGIPTLYIGPRSDIDRFVEASSGGVSLRCGDDEGVAAAIIKLAADRQRLTMLGRQAREFYDRNFAKARGLARYESAIHGILNDGFTAQ
ncbi:MAG: glycosyltransferase family 4 protein [Steroidobacteraceae bacterium]